LYRQLSSNTSTDKTTGFKIILKRTITQRLDEEASENLSARSAGVDAPKKKHKKQKNPEPPAIDSPEQKRKRGRPRKSSQTTESPPAVFNISYYVEVPSPPVLQKGKTRKGDKQVAQEPRKFGPRSVHQGTTWNDLQEALCDLLHVSQDRVDFSSLTWRWNQNKSSSLPLTDAGGFQTMVEQIKVSKQGAAGIILLTIAPPTQRSTSIPVRGTICTEQHAYILFLQPWVTNGDADWKEEDPVQKEVSFSEAKVHLSSLLASIVLAADSLNM
jgi:hypothetical protein